ncbi:MAG: hypothetical protein MJ179_03965 [Treponema sp.]|nr:hypothetical protein [Treponema sp.]
MKKLFILTLLLSSSLVAGCSNSHGEGSEHTHVGQDSYVFDDLNHWHECECGEKVDVTAHVFDQKVIKDEYLNNAANCTSPASYYYSCVCGKKGSETFTNGEALNHQSDEILHSDETNHWFGCNNCDAHLEEEPHNFSTEFTSDETNHWHECECGYKSGVEAHTFKWVVDTEPGYNRKGVRHEECEVCAYKRSEGTEIDEVTKDIVLPYTSDARLDIDEEFVYGEEEYSVKVDNGGADSKFFLTSKALTDFGDNDTLTFYIYGTVAANFHFITQDPWDAKVVAELAANTWNKVTLTKTEVDLLVNQSSNYLVRIASWDSMVWHVSNFVYSTSINPHFTSNGVFEIDKETVYGEDSYSVKLGGTGADVKMYFDEELLTLMGDNDYLLFNIYANSADKDVQYLVNDPWATTSLGSTKENSWVQYVVTKAQVQSIVENPDNYWIRIAVWDSSFYCYVSEFSFAKEATDLDFETNGNAYISNSFVHGEDSYSVLVSCGGSDPRIYFKDTVLTKMGENSKLVFYVYSALSSDNRFVVNDPWAPVALGTLSANVWNKVTLTKEQVSQIVSNKDNYWYDIQSWDCGGWYISELSFEA